MARLVSASPPPRGTYPAPASTEASPSTSLKNVRVASVSWVKTIA
jgi:hypothetical protein